MTSDTSIDAANTAPAKEPRPAKVNWALYAIFARTALSLLAAALLFPYRDDLLNTNRHDHPTWTAKQVADSVAQPGPLLLVTVILAGLVLVVAKYISEGRNWARWLFAAVTVLLTREVFSVAAIFASHGPWVMRITNTLIGLLTIGAIALTFSPDANRFFRARSGGQSRVAGLAALFGRGGAAQTRPAGAAGAAPAARTARPSAPARPLSKRAAARAAKIAAAGPVEPLPPSWRRPDGPKATAARQAAAAAASGQTAGEKPAVRSKSRRRPSA